MAKKAIQKARNAAWPWETRNKAICQGTLVARYNKFNYKAVPIGIATVD